MAKETFYFSHDYNTRTDKKIKALLVKHGYLGYGIFWAIIEDLYNNANALPNDCEGIAYDLRTTPEIVKSILNDFGLFVINDVFFKSDSVQRRLDERNFKSLKASQSAQKRWELEKLNANAQNIDANAVRTLSDGNAIKESKVKDNILLEKESKIDLVSAELKKKYEKNEWFLWNTAAIIISKKEKLKESLAPFVEKYGKDVCNDFWFYWGQPMANKSGKLAWENEKKFEIDARLRTFKNNDKNKLTFKN